MKKHIINAIILSIFLFCSCHAQTSKDDTNNKNQNKIEIKSIILDEDAYLEFIGYYQNYPVFKNYSTDELYISKRAGIFNLLLKYKNNQNPLFVNNRAIVFTKDNDLIIKHLSNDEERVISLPNEAIMLTSNDDVNTIVYCDVDQNIKRLDVQSKEIVDLGIKGNYPVIIKNKLYYSQLENKALDDTYENIYVYDLVNPSSPSLVLNKIMGDPWIITPDEKFVICNKYKEGKGLTVCYINLITKEITFLDSLDNSTMCYYSYQEDLMVFYDPSNPNFRVKKTLK